MLLHIQPERKPSKRLTIITFHLSEMKSAVDHERLNERRVPAAVISGYWTKQKSLSLEQCLNTLPFQPFFDWTKVRLRIISTTFKQKMIRYNSREVSEKLFCHEPRVL